MAEEKRLTKGYFIQLANMTEFNMETWQHESILPYRCKVCGKVGIFCFIRNNSNLKEFGDHDPSTGKSFSEAFILASTNPQYDDRFFMKITSSEHAQNMLCT